MISPAPTPTPTCRETLRPRPAIPTPRAARTGVAAEATSTVGELGRHVEKWWLYHGKMVVSWDFRVILPWDNR